MSRQFYNKKIFKRSNIFTDNNNNNVNYNSNNNNNNNCQNYFGANKYYVNNNNNNKSSGGNRIASNSSSFRPNTGPMRILASKPANNGVAKEESNAKQSKEDTTKEIELKHPLLNRWQLWFQRPSRDKKNDWQNNLIAVIEFDTIEDFWQIYLHVELPTNLTPGSDYSVFKCGIKPMWEDVRNKKGGRWLITVNKTKDRAKDAIVIERMWSEVLMCLVGEAFGDDGERVCGAVFNTRLKYDRISVWTADASEKAVNDRIGLILKQRTNNAQFYYETHFDSQVKTAFNPTTNYNTI